MENVDCFAFSGSVCKVLPTEVEGEDPERLAEPDRTGIPWFVLSG